MSAKKTKKKATGKSAKKSGGKSASKGGENKSRSGAMSATAMRDQSLALLAFGHKVLLDMIGTIPAEKATAQASPATNHVIWTLGHLGMTNDWLASLIDSKPGAIPKSYEALFGMGSIPVTDMSKYPSLAEVRKEFDKAYDRLVKSAKKHTDAELLAPPTGNSFGFTTNKIDSVLKAAWHEGWHLGQICDLRRGLGLAPTMK